ncbi:MAG TPA: hypothetical protein VF920_04900 [Dongiaceae bacterium]
MFKIDRSRAHLAAAYKQNPLDPFPSSELQRLLQRLRWGSVRGRTIIVCTRPEQEWHLGQMGERRGLPVVVGETAFHRYEDALWACFRARWCEVAGEDCPVD